jgi:CBS domain-containing protein
VLTVEELMTTNVVTLTSKDTLGEADVEMKLADIRHLPIVDERHRVVGIVSNRDILRAVGRSGKGQGVRVVDVMTREPFTISPDRPARDAARIMLEQKIGSVPVVSEDGRLVGILTETDFLAVAHDLLEGERAGSYRRQ